MDPGDIGKTGLEVIASCEKWEAAVMEKIKDAAGLVADRCNDLFRSIARLREGLAKTDCMRKKDFDGIMEGVLDGIKEKEKEMKALLSTLHTEELRMLGILRKIAEGGSADFESLKRDIMPRQRAREKKAARILMEIQMEQSELDALLKRLLLRKERLRAKDLKDVINIFKSWQREKRSGTEALLEELSRLRDEIHGRWQTLFSVY